MLVGKYRKKIFKNFSRASAETRPAKTTISVSAPICQAIRAAKRTAVVRIVPESEPAFGSTAKVRSESACDFKFPQKKSAERALFLLLSYMRA